MIKEKLFLTQCLFPGVSNEEGGASGYDLRLDRFI